MESTKYKDTAWYGRGINLDNAVAEYMDYHKPFRGVSPEDNRLEYVWLGQATQIKKKAWNHLTAFANA